MAAVADDLALAFLEIDGKGAGPPACRLKVAAGRSRREVERRREVEELFAEAAEYYVDDHPHAGQASRAEGSEPSRAHFDPAVGACVFSVNADSARHAREAGLSPDDSASRWLAARRGEP